MRNKRELAKRYIFFFVGVWCNAMGIALMTLSALGTGPSTCIPYVLSLRFPLSFGTFTFLFNVLLLVVQMLLLKNQFDKKQWLQLPATFIYAACIDIAMQLFSFIDASQYVVAILLIVIGSIFRALGVSCQVVADVVMLSAEAFVKAVADVSKKEFSVIKLLSDASMVIIAVVGSLGLLGTVHGVREGTILTVLLVGPISHLFTRRLLFANHYFEHEGNFIYDTQLKLTEGKRLVVTVTSEAGSGGRVIARILGELLGLKVYDKELLELVAKEGDFPVEYVKQHNEKLYRNVAEAFVKENFTWDKEDLEGYRHLYDAYQHVILQLAMQQDCIIVGHCANEILRHQSGCLHVHICADMPHRIRYMQDKYHVSTRKALLMIQAQDADMNQYYQHFTGEDWKSAANYHLTMDSTLFGYEGTAQMIEQVVKKNYMELAGATIKEVRQKYHV